MKGIRAMTEETITNPEKLTNRHIAKLLDRLKVLNLPEIAISEIKREMWYLTEDLTKFYEDTGKEGERKSKWLKEK